MREILFRGKKFENNEIGEWVEGYYIRKQDPFIKDLDYHFIAKQNKDRHGILLEVTDWYRVYPGTVGQYTGLTDKNGKKIFEGDVVKIGSEIIEWKCYHEVVFEEGQWFYLHKTPFAKSYMGAWGNSIVEVIGNIYDNPELLGGDYNG